MGSLLLPLLYVQEADGLIPIGPAQPNHETIENPNPTASLAYYLACQQRPSLSRSIRRF
jgi:hypothetical protein